MTSYDDMLSQKATWGPGPWQDEPDELLWTDEVTGYPCAIVRGPIGALNGYVGVPSGHPWAQHGYDAVPVTVHGGLTYAEGKLPHTFGAVAGHWWFGFDTAHGGDLWPGMLPLFEKWKSEGRDLAHHNDETYRDVAYVKEEVRQLAAQLFAAPDNPDIQGIDP